MKRAAIIFIFSLTATLLSAGSADPASSIAKNQQHSSVLTPVKRDAYYFNTRGKWRMKGPFLIQQQQDCLMVTASDNPVSGKKLNGTLTERFFTLKDGGSPQNVCLDIFEESGSGASVGIVFRDFQGESFFLPKKKLKPGENILSWDVNKACCQNKIKSQNNKVDYPIVFTGILLSQAYADKSAKLLFKSFKITELLSPLKAVDVEINTGNPVHVLDARTKKPPVIVVKNRAQAKTQFEMKLVLKNYNGDAIHLSKVFDMKPNEECSWELPWNDKRKRGIWQCIYTLLDKQGNSRDGNLSFAYMTPAGPNTISKPSFWLGMCTRQPRWSLHDQETEALACALAGAKMIRTCYTWGQLEPQPDKWNLAPLDRLVAINGKYNMQLLYLIGYCPRWAAKPERQTSKDWLDWNKSAPELKALKRFVHTLATRYDKQIKYWEFWNEPDLSFWRGTLSEYLACLKTVYIALKEVNPQNKLICGGFAFAGHPRTKKGFQAAVVRDGQPWFDYHGTHIHGSYKVFRESINSDIASYRKALYLPKPLFFSETGFSTTAGTQLDQAKNVVKKIIFAWSKGAKGYMWFDMRNDGFDEGNWEYNYGLMTNDFYPKAGYASYNTLALLLGQAEFVREIPLQKGRSYLFRTVSGQQILVFWCEEEYCAKEVNIIRTDAENVSVCDIMGNVSQTPIIDEALTLQLSHSPSYLILDGAKTLLKAEIPLISFDSEAIVASPGKQISLSMTLRNPYRAAKTIQLQLQAPKGFELSGESQTVTLQPNIQKSVSCMVKVPSDYTARRAVLMLSYNLLLDNKVRGKCRIPINIAVKMPREHFPERPQFVLDKQKNVVTMMGHNPYTAHRLWSGPDDLSMKAWLCVTEKSLKINVLVKDDIFSPSSEAVNSYSCDGIQMAFAVPGQDAYWEIGLAQLKDASPAVYTWKMPSGFKDPSTMIDLKIKQEKQDTEYQIEIPLEALGITHAALTRGVKFNMIVNDNDGEGRDGWVEIAPGIGGSKKIDKFPFIVME